MKKIDFKELIKEKFICYLIEKNKYIIYNELIPVIRVPIFKKYNIFDFLEKEPSIEDTLLDFSDIENYYLLQYMNIVLNNKLRYKFSFALYSNDEDFIKNIINKESLRNKFLVGYYSKLNLMLLKDNVIPPELYKCAEKQIEYL